jgi:hypothetical protein
MPWKYTALAVYMIGLQAEFKNSLLPEYVERYVSAGVIASPDPCAAYDGITTNYGITFGPDGSGTGCIKGAGRWTSKHGTNIDYGLYSNTFGNAMWKWYKANY